METHRLFIAISVPDGVKDEMEKAQTELKRALAGAEVRWTKRSQFHLTLRFLGEVAVERIDELIRTVQGVVKTFSSFHLRAQGIGAFPKMNSPRVIWAGVSDQENILVKLRSAVENAIQTFSDEKPEGAFSGHVTLGRVRALNRSQTETFAKLAGTMTGRSFGEWKATEVEIIRSELLPGGSRYTRVAEARLKTEG